MGNSVCVCVRMGLRMYDWMCVLAVSVYIYKLEVDLRKSLVFSCDFINFRFIIIELHTC